MSVTREDAEKAIDNRMQPIAAANARSSWINSKMLDIPRAYREQMPADADPNKLADAEQAIRAQFRKDWDDIHQRGRQAGHLPVELYSPESMQRADELAKQEPPLTGIDMSKLTPEEKIEWSLSGKVPGSARQKLTAGVDYSHMSSTDQILTGLRQGKAARGQGPRR